MAIDQYYGLNKWARQLTLATEAATEYGTRCFADGRIEHFEREVQVPLAKIEKIADIESAFGGSPVAQLNRYTLPDGQVLDEFVQSAEWHGGPCIYVALQDEHRRVIRESLWTREEMV
jgi:hypothetical protein